MTSAIFQNLTKIIAKQGTREDIDSETRSYHLSELTLVVTVKDKKINPQSISFNLFGTEITRTAQGQFVIVDFVDDKVESFAIENNELLDEINQYLEWRLRVLEKFDL